MPRLYDRIVSGEVVLGGRNETSPAIEQATVVQIDNVAAYFYDTKGTFADDPGDSWQLMDFPCISLPLSPTWFDFRVPWLGAHVGVLAWVADESDTGFLMSAEVFLRESRNSPIVFVGEFHYPVHRDGRPGRLPSGALFCKASAYYRARFESMHEPDFNQYVMVANAKVFLWPTLLATSFMHCKNVETRTVDQPAKLSKKWVKKHGQPLVRYRVLDIDPMRKILNTEGNAGTNGLRKALHICRGHFATYTEDRPLFGRHVGTFWKPQHVRGSAKSGVVVKDYSVQAVRT